MNKKERAQYVLSEMRKLFPEAKSELKNWSTPFQFLICIILSAQTTDAQVNKVTTNLFKKLPDPSRLARAKQGEVEKLIKSINYFRTKSKNIIKAADLILGEFNGVVPADPDDLLKIPGVGRKTAHVFLNGYYKANLGIGADTHIMRVAERLGLSSGKGPTSIARDLEKVYPQKDWADVNTLFVLYGRYYCKSRMSKSKCIFKEICSYCRDK